MAATQFDTAPQAIAYIANIIYVLCNNIFENKIKAIVAKSGCVLMNEFFSQIKNSPETAQIIWKVGVRLKNEVRLQIEDLWLLQFNTDAYQYHATLACRHWRCHGVTHVSLRDGGEEGPRLTPLRHLLYERLTLTHHALRLTAPTLGRHLLRLLRVCSTHSSMADWPQVAHTTWTTHCVDNTLQ